MKGKEAARAATRRANEADAKLAETKQRLADERAVHGLQIDALKKEITRLKEERTEEAALLAASEVVRLAVEIDELTRLLAEQETHTATVMAGKDYLIRNACKYVSMTMGIGPGEAFDMVATWITGENFEGTRDIDTYIEQLDVPADGWTAEQLRATRNIRAVQAKAGHVRAVSLEEAEAEGHAAIHPGYRPEWYADNPKPRYTMNRRTGGRGRNAGVIRLQQTKMTLRPRNPGN